MKFPRLAKLVREELQGGDLRKFLDKFLPSYAALLDSTTNTLTNNVSIRDNLAGHFVELKGVRGARLKALEFAWDRKDQPLMISLCQLRLVTPGAGGAQGAGTVGLSGFWNVGTNIPDTHMEEDGRALAVADYPELYAVIGNDFDTQTDPTTGATMSAPGPGLFRIPHNKGLYKRGAGNSYRAGGTKLVSISVGMYMDDMTAKNGLTGASTSGSGTTANNNVGHTHSISITSGNNSVGHTHGPGSMGANSAGGHQHLSPGNAASTGSFPYGGAAGPGGSFVAFQVTSGLTNIGYTQSAGAHTHPIGGITGTQSVNHTHSVSGTSGGVSANHTHTFSVTMVPLLADGDAESRPRSRGALHVIQVKPISGSGSGVPGIDPRWTFDGERVRCSVTGVQDDAEYNVRLFVQS